MALGWNEIKERAIRFSNEWRDTHNEEADAKPFLVEFFNVFGITSRKVATFEHRVKKLGEFDVPHVSFNGNLASDNQSVARSDGKIKGKRLYLNKSSYELDE